MEKPARAAWIGAIIAALITLPGLGVGTLWDNSETAYGEVAREILLTHDWVVMHLNAVPWFIQPPLYFWIAAAFAHLFGVTSFALRLPSALATIAMGGMTGYAVARQTGTVRAGLFASVVLSSCFMQAIVGRLAIMDALLDLAVAFAIFWWFRGLQSGRSVYFVYGCIAAALGFLAKGPVAPVVALIVIVPYAIWNRRAETTHAPSWRAWVFGIVAFLAIVAPWFIALISRTGLHAVIELIGHYTVGRYTGVIENQSGPFWYYLPVLILGFFPWIAFLPMAVVWGFRRLQMRSASPEIARLLRLAFVWTVVPLLFFSAAKTKLPNYIALEFPALALLVGLYLDAVALGARRRAAVISAATVPVFTGMIAVAVMLFTRDNHLTTDVLALVPDLAAMGAAIFVGAVVTLILLAVRSTSAVAPYALGLATLIAVDTLALFALPHAEQFKPVPQLAKVINAQRRPNDIVAIQSMAGGNSLLFYTEPPVAVLAAPDAHADSDGLSARKLICGAPRAFVVAPKKRPPFDPTYGRDRRVIAQSGKAVLFLYDGPACRR